MALVKIPDNRFIISLFRKKGVPVHIIRHCVKVSKLADIICRHLPKETTIDSNLVRAGALLHDISKMEAILRGRDHAKIGADLLRKMGFFEVAEIVRQHVFLDKPVCEYDFLKEEIIVNYADKRIRHTEFVSLEERFEDILNRYGKNEESIDRINRLFEESKMMEIMIFEQLSIGPTELAL